MEAFEPLIRAKNHKDPEIAARARYLVRQIQVNLVMPDDSPQVATLMRNIFLLDRRKRESRIAELAMLPDGEGLAALCRLIRFSESEASAKTAAVGIIQSRLYNKKELASMAAELSSSPRYTGRTYSLNVYQTRTLFQAAGSYSKEKEKKFGQPLGQKESDEIRRLLKSCDRPAAKLVFAWFDFAEAKTDAEKKAAYEEWDKLCRQEEKFLENNPTRVTPAIFSFLLTIQIEKSVELKLSDQTQIDLVRRQLKRTHFWNRTNFKEIINRLIDEKIWKLADMSIPEFGTVMMRAYNQETLPRFFCLMIHASEDQDQTEDQDQGDKNQAGKDQAEKVPLVDSLFELYEKSFPSRGTAKAAFHLQCAMVFTEEGLYDRAIAQYEATIKVENMPQSRSPERLLCWYGFQGIMDLHEGRDQFELAAKTSDAMLKKLESLNDTQKKRAAVALLVKKTKSHSAYYRVMAEKKNGNEAAYRKLLGEASHLYPESGRTLIECYRLPVTPKSQKFRDRIVKQIKKTITSLTKQAKAGSNREINANWAAWLVANTEGDLDSVIELLESVPTRHSKQNSGSLDTLALCYFKKGEVAKAVSLQREAVEQSPYDSRLQKAWKTLSEAYEKKTGKKPEPPKTGTARFRMRIGLSS